MKKKSFRLKNNNTIIIRDLTSKDLKKSLEFFSAIPESKRRFFRSDVTNEKHLNERAKQSEAGKIVRRISLLDNKIVGDASLEVESDSWKSGSAYLRLVVPGTHLGKGIQYAMAKDMYDIAHDKKLEKNYCQVYAPAKGPAGYLYKPWV